MVVFVIAVVPDFLRGVLTRWLIEIATGVYVGVLPARVRDEVWDRVCTTAGTGRAIMVHTARGEQRLAFKVHQHSWEVIDVDGLKLMRRPAAGHIPAKESPYGWSNAGRRRRSQRG